MKHIILLNGPPGSGKDYLAKVILWRNYGLHEKMANPISWALKGMISSDDASWSYIREHCKNVPILKDRPPLRDAMISFSEDWAKKVFGEVIFAELLWKRLELIKEEHGLAVISDCGFQKEHNWFVEVCRKNDIEPVLIRIKREGHNFDGDSREYVEPQPDQIFFEWNNEGNLESALLMENVVKELLSDTQKFNAWRVGHE